MHIARLVSIAALVAVTGLGVAACSPRDNAATSGTGAGGTTGGSGTTSGSTMGGSPPTPAPTTTTPAMPPASAASQ